MKQEFADYLGKTSLEERHKSSLLNIFDYFENQIPSIFADRIFLLEGEPGIGKSFLAKKLLTSLKTKKFFLGQTDCFQDMERVESLDKLLKLVEKLDEGIIYLDDLKYILNFVEYDSLENKYRKNFMRLLEYFKDNNKKTILVISLNDSDFMDESWRDRIDCKIGFNLPSNENKLGFLESNFSEYCKLEEMKYLSENSLGYNYRDLPNILKIAYNLGKKSISTESIKSALKIYTPTNLEGFRVFQGIETKLEDLNLKPEMKERLTKIKLTFQNNEEIRRNGVSNLNLFAFEGPPGVGKTHTAIALAGELNIPFVKLGAREVYGRRFGFSLIFEKIKRFQNTVVLIDDVDKVIEGNSMHLDDGGSINSELNSFLDELNSSALILFSVNDSNRLGKALKDRLEIIKFENPDTIQRKSYFQDLVKKTSIKFNVLPEDFAKLTEGMNYRDLERFWKKCVIFSIEHRLDVLELGHLSSLTCTDKKSPIGRSYY